MPTDNRLLLLRLAPFLAVAAGFNIDIHHPLQRPTSSLYVSFTADVLVSPNTPLPPFPTAVLTPPTIQEPETIMNQETTTVPAETPASVIRLTWETDVEQHIRQAVQERVDRPHVAEPGTIDEAKQPFMVGIVGIPGSGKSTSCSILTGLLRDVGCLLMPFDGYHYPVNTLKSKSNADDLLYRRGAPDTFDVDGLRRDLHTMRYGHLLDQNDVDGYDKASTLTGKGKYDIVMVPGFDHAAGDPEPDAHEFDRSQHRVVVCEGLYLLHDDENDPDPDRAGSWASLKSLFDLTIFVNANVDTCIDRLKSRNKCIPGYTPEEIDIRCDAVDRVNAMTVMGSRNRADLVVESAAA